MNIVFHSHTQHHHPKLIGLNKKHPRVSDLILGGRIRSNQKGPWGVGKKSTPILRSVSPIDHGNGKLHPGRLTWNIQITHLERKMIFQTSMIMFHVNLPGCTQNKKETHIGDTAIFD